MASLDELQNALRNADAAGDANAARMLAAEIVKMRGSEPRSVMDNLTGTSGPRYQTWPEKAVRGLIGDAKDSATIPGDVAGGKTAIQPSTPGMWSDEDEARQQLTDAETVKRKIGRASCRERV